MTALTLDDILRVLPHRYPFLFVDAVLELERGVRIVAIKNVSANEPWFGGHFPERPMMPGLLITEALAQAGAILLLTEQAAGSDRLVYFASLDDVHWHETVRAGDQIRLEIVVAQRRGRLNKVQGRALVGGMLVCEATMGAMVVDR